MRSLNEIIAKTMRFVAPATHFIPLRMRKNFVARVESLMTWRQNQMIARRLKPLTLKRYDIQRYPYGVNLIGHLKAPIGLGQGARLYARSVEKLPVPHCFVNIDLPENRAFAETEYVGRLGEPAYSINVSHINPDMTKHSLTTTPPRYWLDRYNIATWAWELEEFPKEWCFAFQYYDEIWTQSDFERDAVQKSSPIPVYTVPYGVSVGEIKYGRDHFALPGNAFIALAMYDTQSHAARKNPEGALNAFLKAFDDQKDALLVLKMNNPKKKDLDALKQKIQGRHDIILLNKVLTRDEVNSLIACSDVFISLHRSEGFGLVIAEAMCMGVPVVATNWSGNTQFMDESCACAVRFSMTPVGDRYPFGRNDLYWAEPDINHAAEYLKKLYSDKEYRARIGRAGKERIKKELSIEKTAQLMMQRFEAIQISLQKRV